MKCTRHVCSLVIVTRSCTDIISEEAIKKVGLKVEPHSKSYGVDYQHKTTGYLETFGHIFC